MVASGVMEDYTYLWYDVRPHPNLGTVEIRCCDSQTRVEHTVALTALIQAMVNELAEHYDEGTQLADYPWQMLDENKWLAARHGLEGEIVDLPSNERVDDEGADAAPARAPDAARPGARRRATRSTASATCSSAATAPRGRSSSTRPTTTSTRSWRRSSPPPRHERRRTSRGRAAAAP